MLPAEPGATCMTALELVDLHRGYTLRGRRIPAVDGVSLTVAAGEIVGLVGESGCGKTTLARLAACLLDPERGEVRFGGGRVSHLGEAERRGFRTGVQIVFQDPLAALNPRRCAGQLVAEPLRLNAIVPPSEIAAEVARLLAAVGLSPPLAERRPHELSGGQRQRVAIARALALRPKILICDEPVAALDVSVRAQILNLLLDLNRRSGLGILFISHDLSVVRRIAARVAVMYLGRLVELADGTTIWRRPAHPYTRLLIDSIPRGTGRRTADAGRRAVPAANGDASGPGGLESGCRFAPRCAHAVERCRAETPALRPIVGGGQAACFRVEEIRLAAEAAD
jgi:oligopeptide/dipeptide ABC transporter ATP-binding protein